MPNGSDEDLKPCSDVKSDIDDNIKVLSAIVLTSTSVPDTGHQDSDGKTYNIYTRYTFTLQINVLIGVAVASSEDLGCDEEHGLKICNATSNPTKDYQKQLGMVYSPGREKLQKPNLLRRDEYCFKCHTNTGNAFLDNCDHCNTVSFIGCGYKIQWRDDDSFTGESTFLCCYCGSLHRDIAFTLDIDSDKMPLTLDLVDEWASKQETTELISFARKLYEAKIANNGRTVNEYSERLYGNYNDDSTQLAVCIYNIHWNMKESTEHVCPECDQAYKDVIDLTAQYNPICIDCAAESYYNSRGHKLDKNARMIFHYHRYNAGLYPQSENYVDGGFCNTESVYTAIPIPKADLWSVYFSDRWPYLDAKKCCFVRKDSKGKNAASYLLDPPPDTEAYYIYDNEYTTLNEREHVEVYIHWMIPLGRKIAMLFYKSSGYSNFLKMVTIEQYADMVKCR